MKTGGFRDQISTKTHAAISLKIIAFESSFPKVYFKSGPRVHRPPRFRATDRKRICLTFCIQKIHVLTELSPAQRKSHGLNSLFRSTHFLCQE